MVGTRKSLGEVDIGVKVKWIDNGISRKGVVIKNNGNNTFDIETPSGTYASVQGTELGFVKGQEVVGRENLGVAQARGVRRWVVPSERVTEVRWWEWLGVIFQQDMKWKHMANKLERKGKAKL